MAVWLDADGVAARLGVARRTAMGLMEQMPHSVISGTVRKRVRVSEDALEAWMLKRSSGTAAPVSRNAGTQKKLQRR